MENHTFNIFNDTDKAATFAASLIESESKAAIANNGQFNLVLTGGSSPLKLHKLLSQAPFNKSIDWEKVHIFWGDERFVPYESEISNTRMAYETLLNNLDIPSRQIHEMDTNAKDVATAALSYEKAIKSLFKTSPSFDMILLGVGDDGHTASLFPGTPVVYEKDKLVATSYNKQQETERITLTAPLINEAKLIIPMVFGEKKAKTLKEVI
ncbi:MAG: 6-phosphogluconolactonase, partial [Bacteroidota bacterium]